MKKLLILTVLALSPLFASAANQGSVSYACGTTEIKEFDLQGVTFTIDALAKQGYTVSVVNGVVDLNKGQESIAIGTLLPLNECSYSMGLQTAFINFNNANLKIGTDVKELGPCRAITTDGDYGIDLLVTITFVTVDNGYSTSLSSHFGQGYNSMEQCQSEHPQK